MPFRHGGVLGFSHFKAAVLVGNSDFGILRIRFRAIIGRWGERGKASPGASAQLYHASRVFVGVAIFCGAGFSLHPESRLKPAPQELPPNLATPVFPSARLLFSLRNALIKLL